jgi:hypothetical protein
VVHLKSEISNEVRKAMNDDLRQLLDEAISDIPEVREEGILQIAMLLERHSPLRDTPTFYRSIQRAELADVELDATQQQEVIDKLYALILTTRTNSSMIWALGKVQSPTVLRYLVDLICGHRDRLPDDSKQQALRAINRFLSVSEDDHMYSEMRLLGSNRDFRNALEELAAGGQVPKLLVQRIIGKL